MFVSEYVSGYVDVAVAWLDISASLHFFWGKSTANVVNCLQFENDWLLRSSDLRRQSG